MIHPMCMYVCVCIHMYVYVYIYIYMCVYDMCVYIYIYICCMYMLGSIAYNEDIVNNDHQQTNVVLLGKMKSELHHSYVMEEFPAGQV